MFYGWWIVTAGTIVEMLSGALLYHAFTAYVLPLQAEFGWSKTQVALAFALQRLQSGILGPLQGLMVDRYGPRLMMSIGIIIFASGFALFSQMQSLSAFYIAALVMSLGSSLGGWMPIIASVTNWFVRRRAMAMGIVMCGIGVGGFMVPGVVWIISTHGWRTMALLSAGLMLLLGLPIAQFMRHRPEPYGYAPDGVEEPSTRGELETEQRPARAPRLSEPDFTAREAIATRTFWMLMLIHSTAVVSVTSILVHQIPHMVEGVGLSDATAASIVAVMLAFMIIGQLLGGVLGDRVDKRYPIFVGLWMHMVGLLSFAYATSITGALIFAVLHGLAWGTRGTAINAIRAEYFGRRSFATISGYASLLIMMGATAGPLVCGAVFDYTGSYRFAFIGLGTISAAVSIAVFFLKPPLQPLRSRLKKNPAPVS